LLGYVATFLTEKLISSNEFVMNVEWIRISKKMLMVSMDALTKL